MQKQINSLPCISIITVSFNALHTIEQTIESVINQTYKNIEYIIIDGASTDGTTDIIKKYSDIISYWVSEPDNGVYYAMNKGIDVASGEYIFFLGSDDVLVSRDIIEKAVDYLVVDTTIDMLSGQVWVVDEELCLQKKFTNSFSDEDIFNGKNIPHQGLFVKSAIMKKEKFDISYQIASDYDFILKCFYSDNVKIKKIDLMISFYSNGGMSSTLDNRNAEHATVMKKYHLNQDKINHGLRKPSKMKTTRRRIRKDINEILLSIKFLQYIKRELKNKLSKKWVAHTCEWTNCRWCKKFK